MNIIRYAFAALLLFPATAFAQPVDNANDPRWFESWIRWSVAIGVNSWPAAADVEPLVGGGFDDAGPVLEFSAHFRTAQTQKSELLTGIDFGAFSSESNIPLFTDTVTARGMYITPSVKWMFGKKHRYSLDAGVGYYLVDIAEVEHMGASTSEIQIWENSALGGYLGGTWDVGSNNPEKTHGMSLGLKVHFVDFGQVSDQDIFLPPRFGASAGALTGPVYQLQFGYRWR